MREEYPQISIEPGGNYEHSNMSGKLRPMIKIRTNPNHSWYSPSLSIEDLKELRKSIRKYIKENS